MKFSQRLGKVELKNSLQVESINEDLLNRLWNTISEDFLGVISTATPMGKDSRQAKACKKIWREFLNKPVDYIPRNIRGIFDYLAFKEELRAWFFFAKWYKVYDLIEFIVELDNRGYGLNLEVKFNNDLKREHSGYRIIKKIVTRITDEVEVQEIEEALDARENRNSIRIHLEAAIRLLSDKENPDYRNSIKESVSAVESYCNQLVGEKSKTLGQVLKDVDLKFKINGSLKSAFSSIYGYASNSGGIRHGMTEETYHPNFEEAKFMLVACSAFINYLKLKTHIGLKEFNATLDK